MLPDAPAPPPPATGRFPPRKQQPLTTEGGASCRTPKNSFGRMFLCAIACLNKPGGHASHRLPATLTLLLLGAAETASGGGPGSAAAAATSTAMPEPWDASPHVQEVDYAQESAHLLIKARAPGAPPLVIRNAVTGDGLEPLLKFGKLKTLQKALKSKPWREKSKIDKTFSMPDGVKVAYKGERTFSYWDKSMKWLGYELYPFGTLSLPDIPKQRSWHKWTFEVVSIQDFFTYFEKRAVPYMYWLSSIPAAVLKQMGLTVRSELCNRMAPAKETPHCLGQANSTDGDGVIWANSAGMVTQAHFDRESGIFVQISGQKRWTIWEPSQHGSLCFHPYIHPANRQCALTHSARHICTGTLLRCQLDSTVAAL